MKYRLVSMLGVVIIIAASSLLPVTSQEPGQSPKTGFMRLKLEPAKKILEGIALGDFQMVRTSSEQLRKLSLDEGWMVLQTEAYNQHSQDFKSSLNLISRMCEEKDLDGVSLAYMQMTMRCVQCHKSLRDLSKS